MPRGSEVYLDDILEAIRRIELYTRGVSYDSFRQDLLVQDGVARNLEIIGEAVKKLPLDLRGRYPIIDWKKVAGLRDVLIHEYAAVELAILWDVVETRLPELKVVVQGMRAEVDREPRGDARDSRGAS